MRMEPFHDPLLTPLDSFPLLQHEDRVESHALARTRFPPGKLAAIIHSARSVVLALGSSEEGGSALIGFCQEAAMTIVSTLVSGRSGGKETIRSHEVERLYVSHYEGK